MLKENKALGPTTDQNSLGDILRVSASQLAAEEFSTYSLQHCLNRCQMKKPLLISAD